MPLFFRKFLNQYPFLKQFIKFCLVGGTSAAMNFVVLYFLTELFDVWYVYSAIFGFIVSATFNFSANKFWTFRSQQKGMAALGQAVRYIIVMVSGLIINTVLIYSFTEFERLDYRLSWVLATGLVTLWNFCLNRLWTFKYKPQSQNLPLNE
jgi:putative flippase GtrA